jgi:hypothetical protein
VMDDPNVEYVEPDNFPRLPCTRRGPRFGLPSTPWGITRVTAWPPGRWAEVARMVPA